MYLTYLQTAVFVKYFNAIALISTTSIVVPNFIKLSTQSLNIGLVFIPQHNLYTALPDVRRVKSNDNILFCYSHCHQLLTDILFCTIPLNPNLAVFDIKMHHRAKNPMSILPTNIYQLVMVLFSVKNCLSFNFIIRGGALSIFCK